VWAGIMDIFMGSYLLLCQLDVQTIQDKRKRTLHFQNDMKNKCSILRTSHLHQSIEKLEVFFFSNDWGDFCCGPLLDATCFENGYTTTEELACSTVCEKMHSLC
jgi:hypothetical protein